MNQQEYAEYLFKLLGEEPRAADKYNVWEDYFYGLFQGFMPDGEGVAVVFEPLERDRNCWRASCLCIKALPNTIKKFSIAAIFPAISVRLRKMRQK